MKMDIKPEIKDIVSLKKLNRIQKQYKNIFSEGGDDNSDTFIKGIKSVNPGHFGFFKKEFVIKKYWDLKYSNKNNYNSEEFKELFEENMKLHLRSDVPVAFTLSGGIDSISIAMHTTKIKQY